VVAVAVAEEDVKHALGGVASVFCYDDLTQLYNDCRLPICSFSKHIPSVQIQSLRLELLHFSVNAVPMVVSIPYWSQGRTRGFSAVKKENLQATVFSSEGRFKALFLFQEGRRMKTLKSKKLLSKCC
jgi:hypothetical protein